MKVLLAVVLLAVVLLALLLAVVLLALLLAVVVLLAAVLLAVVLLAVVLLAVVLLAGNKKRGFRLRYFRRGFRLRDFRRCFRLRCFRRAISTAGWHERKQRCSSSRRVLTLLGLHRPHAAVNVHLIRRVGLRAGGSEYAAWGPLHARDSRLG